MYQHHQCGQLISPKYERIPLTPFKIFAPIILLFTTKLFPLNQEGPLLFIF